MLDSEKLLKKKFNAKNGGYDALEVDEFFDQVRSDYETFNAQIKELERQVKRFEQLNAKNVNLEALNLQLSRKVKELERLVAKGGWVMSSRIFAVLKSLL